MASVTSNVSPIHSEAMISYPYGVIDSGYSCGFHTGVDLVPHRKHRKLPTFIWLHCFRNSCLCKFN